MESEARNGTDSLTEKTFVVANKRDFLTLEIVERDALGLGAACKDWRIVVDCEGGEFFGFSLDRLDGLLRRAEVPKPNRA